LLTGSLRASIKASAASLQTLNADLVVTAMEDSRARLKIMLLDACRTPFKGPGGGLVSMQAPAGTVIGFATQPNHTAQQGPLRGVSPYAEALAYFMGVKGSAGEAATRRPLIIERS
jgi:hypothetical protein